MGKFFNRLLDQLKNTTIRENELTASNNDLEKNSIQEAEHLGHLIVKRSPIKMASLVEKKIKCYGEDGPCYKSCGDSWQKRDSSPCRRCISRNPDCKQQLIKWESQEPKKIKCNGEDGPCYKVCGDSWQKKDWHPCQRCIKRNPDCAQQLIKWESREPKKREKKERRRRRKKWF